MRGQFQARCSLDGFEGLVETESTSGSFIDGGYGTNQRHRSRLQWKKNPSFLCYKNLSSDSSTYQATKLAVAVIVT